MNSSRRVGFAYEYVGASSSSKEKDLRCSCTGFPDTSLGYRKLFQPLCDAGYDVYAPDLAGYGQTTFRPGWDPSSDDAYAMEKLTGRRRRPP